MKRTIIGVFGVLVVAGWTLWLGHDAPRVQPVYPDIGLARPSELTTWPWPGAKADTPHRGVTHWLAHAKDGTTVDLLKFDFKANPRLRFALYSQDEDDAKPFDNVVRYWPMGVGQATRHLNRTLAPRAGVLAAWNGPFFGYYRSGPAPDETAFHLAPVVLRGKVYFNKGNHRWTWGVKQTPQGPVFKVFHLPGRRLLQREFDYATGTVQCLLLDGKPLKMEHFPVSPMDRRKPPVPSTPAEAGHIPFFDHAKFSRTSFAWSRDSRHLYALLVRESNKDSEGNSIQNLHQWRSQSNGWNVPDVQRFWLSMRDNGLVWNAINSDAGDVGQMVYRLPEGKYLLVSPQGVKPSFERKAFGPEFTAAPEGGSLSYYYVSEES